MVPVGNEESNNSRRTRHPTISAQPHHVHLCFHALTAHVDTTSHMARPHVATHLDALLARDAFPPCPLFITWNTRDGQTPNRKDLRGCIGTFRAEPLARGLRDFALTASQRDSRFPPIQKHELEDLECCVSLLHSFEDASAWDDWEVGVHGISIRFSVGDDTYEYSATFLPEVASEQRWDCHETIRHLIRKSGCYLEERDERWWVFGRGSDDGVELGTVLEVMRVERYQSSKCSGSFAEYLAFTEDVRDV